MFSVPLPALGFVEMVDRSLISASLRVRVKAFGVISTYSDKEHFGANGCVRLLFSSVLCAWVWRESSVIINIRVVGDILSFVFA